MVTENQIKSPFKLFEDINKARKQIPDSLDVKDQYHRTELFGALAVVHYLITGDESEWQKFLNDNLRP